MMQEGTMARIVSKVRQLRLEKQAKEGREIDIEEVANAIGISRPALSNIELGKTQRIDFGTLMKLCDYYGVGVGELLEYHPDTRMPVYASA
jgi:DNA-binding Xre family transcriptional regulator